MELILDTTYSQFIDYETYPADLKASLERTASYFVKGAQFSEKVRSGKWDGRIYLLNAYGRVPTGLAGVLAKVFKEKGYRLLITDRITYPEPKPWKWVGPELRDYQVEAVDKCLAARRDIVELPTRTGKTYFAGKLIQSLGLRTFYLVTGKESMYQAKNELESWIEGPTFGFYGDGKKDTDADITIGLIQSLNQIKSAKSNPFKNVDVILIDEVHKAASDTNYKFFMGIPAPYRFGMSVGRESLLHIKINGESQVISIEDFYGTYTPSNLYEVMGFNGNEFGWHRILDVVKHKPETDVLKLDIQYGKKLVITEDHSVFRLEIQDEYWKQGSRRKVGALNCVKGKDLQEGDYLVMPWAKDEAINEPIVMYSPNDSFEGRKKWIEEIIYPIDISFLLGYFIGDGWVSGNKIGFAVANKDIDWFEDYINSLCWADLSSYSKGEYEGCYNVIVYNYYLNRWFQKYFKNIKAKSKYIPPFVFDWSYKTKLEFVAGLLCSDGHIQCKNGRENQAVYTTVSKRLAEELVLLLMSMGIVAGININRPGISKRVKGNRISYRVTWSLAEGSNYCGPKNAMDIRFNGKSLKINGIKKIKRKEVFDLSVDGVENFLAIGILVHNSGTAFRTDNKDVKMIALLGRLIYVKEQEEMWDRGIIERPVVYWLSVGGPSLHRAMHYRHHYRSGIIECTERNRLVGKILEKCEGRQILISVENTARGEVLEAMYKDAFGVVFVHGKSPKDFREQVFEGLKNNTLKVVIATRIFNESLTFPDLAVLINCAGRKSTLELIQKYGRVQGKGDKSDVAIYDFKDDHSHYLSGHARQRYKELEKRGYEQVEATL